MINYESMPEVLNLMVAIVMVMCVCMAITEVLKVYAKYKSKNINFIKDLNRASLYGVIITAVVTVCMLTLAFL